ncbi:sigma-70 family RNA polymerase sigma factor [Caulobacter soli]|uniref:sigma-70 family RNA polymerase sigma factor n=1 Tax=Caulobacter soli TaxID=2708539 RepID=UPI0013EC9803|nr:sigma-70 family RNA polymerase sigma factor [Caulobacter soli]
MLISRLFADKIIFVRARAIVEYGEGKGERIMTATSGQPRGGTDAMSLDDLEDALDQLNDEDVERLVAKAGAYALGTGVEPVDLLHDAITAALDGTRSWPRSIMLEAFLVMSMKSIASNLRRKARRTTPVDMSSESHGVQEAQQRFVFESEDQALSGIRCKALIEKVHDLFSDDEQALAVVLGRFDELSVQEICDFGNFDRKAYETVSKRVQRKLGEAVRGGAIQ